MGKTGVQKKSVSYLKIRPYVYTVWEIMKQVQSNVREGSLTVSVEWTRAQNEMSYVEAKKERAENGTARIERDRVK